MRFRRRIVGFALALVAGVVIGVLLWPAVQREMMLRELFSEEAAQRLLAAQWWSEPADPSESDVSRLAEQPAMAQRIVERLERVEVQDVFVEVASLMRETELWEFPLISTRLWARRLNLILDSNDDAAADSVLDEMQGVEVARDDEHAIAIWERLLNWEHHASVRRRALMGAAAWFGRAGIERYAAAARSDPDAAVRRLAWLLLGHLQPASGYAGMWKEEEPAAAEAMLWAATVTNRDDASPLLAASDASPWPTAALPWLLAQSDDPAARARLEELIVDGNRSAMLHLAERWETGAEKLPTAQQAWLGVVPEGMSEEELRLRRWAAWRATSGDAGHLLDDPIAEDGSVWAAVLLAERLLDEQSCAALARRWLDDLEPAVRAAGALLHGLCVRDGPLLLREYEQSSDPLFRRGARLAMLMARAEGDSFGTSSSERAYAWMIVASPGGERIAALMALLASGDREAAEAVLTAPAEGSAGAAVLERAWLIERFLPEYAALVAPLCPWNDQVAALQLDIMRSAFALDGDAAFDVDSRVFPGGAITPSR